MAITTSFSTVKLVKGGTISGSNYGTGDITSSLTDYDFGGATDMWGLALSDTDINDSTFGVAISFTGAGDVNNYVTRYIKATDFGFAVPGGATIDGVKVTISALWAYSGRGVARVQFARIDRIGITVYYTAAAATDQPRFSYYQHILAH